MPCSDLEAENAENLLFPLLLLTSMIMSWHCLIFIAMRHGITSLMLVISSEHVQVFMRIFHLLVCCVKMIVIMYGTIMLIAVLYSHGTWSLKLREHDQGFEYSALRWIFRQKQWATGENCIVRNCSSYIQALKSGSLRLLGHLACTGNIEIMQHYGGQEWREVSAWK